ncbi:pyridoxal phosphate-dependent aminotransferase [Lactobacillus sp. ESL0791]|uniref:MalY/PatB family protein n=1 Tax=Lactobacillus sp. ESL0791 TaxID=2983234 RepID=UPI0023F64A8B|nr:MalY/PatB family protein [Lactobacillus sp. ESL0791]MDF7639661.1 pyridoxal phosphate-dependent aminotransferase [Lactobacillus sp. ESL0791]
MKYNFETCISRKGKGSYKWDEMSQQNPNLPDDVSPLSVADMEFSVAPEILDGLKQRLEDNPILGYEVPTNDYYDAVIGWMKKIHNWQIKKEWIVPNGSVVPALVTSIKAFTKPEDSILIMTPVYYPFYDVINYTHRKIITSPLKFNGEKYTIDFTDLAAKASDINVKMLILCSPHNPVGRVWTKEELKKIANICLTNKVLVLSDEIHSDLLMPGSIHTPYATISENAADNSVICTAPSKTFNTAGMQAANIIIKNPYLRNLFEDQQRRKGDSGMPVNLMGLQTVQLAYSKGEPWYHEMLKVIDSNRQYLEDYIGNNIPEIKVLPMEGTYLQWWDCTGLGFSDYQTLNKFMKQKAFLFFDDGYMFGEAGSQFERINIACPQATLQKAMERLTKAVKKLRN